MNNVSFSGSFQNWKMPGVAVFSFGFVEAFVGFVATSNSGKVPVAWLAERVEICSKSKGCHSDLDMGVSLNTPK